MNAQQVLDWLPEGDVSIQYQVHRDLPGVEREDLQCSMAEEGWGKRFLSARNPNGHWGLRIYQPKWTSTHYTVAAANFYIGLCFYFYFVFLLQ